MADGGAVSQGHWADRGSDDPGRSVLPSLPVAANGEGHKGGKYQG